MKNPSWFIKTFFALTLMFFMAQGLYIHFTYKSQLNVICLELADGVYGSTKLYQLWLTGKEGMSLIRHAWINTIVDFFFIIAYVGMIRIISKNLRQKEKNKTQNKLLRWNMHLAIIAGILDVMENIILLWDFGNYYPGEYFISPRYISYPKWLLIGWIISIWIISIIKRKSIAA